MVWTRYDPPVHVAPSLNALAAQFDALFPHRIKDSDGALGNASHQAEVSDHNPDWKAKGARRGIIRAIDLTTTSWGVAGHAYTPAQRAWHQRLIADLIATEIANKVDRLWYLIHWIPGDPYPKIWSRTTGWEPKRYTGASPHDHHFHTSIERTPDAENDTSPWFTALRGGIPAGPVIVVTPTTPQPSSPTGTVPAVPGKAPNPMADSSITIDFSGTLDQPLSPGDNVVWLGPVASDGQHPLSVLKAPSAAADVTATLELKASTEPVDPSGVRSVWRTVAYQASKEPVTVSDEIPVAGSQNRYAGAFNAKVAAGKSNRLRLVIVVPAGVTGLVLHRFTVRGWAL